MTRPVLVKAFLEGASLATLAELLGCDLPDLEAGFRLGLIEIQAAGAHPAPEAVALPTPPPAPEGGASSPRPARFFSSQMREELPRKRVAARMDQALDLTGYPAPLQDPRAEAQRKAYDALKQHGPQSLGELAERLGVKSDTMMGTLVALRKNALAVKDDGYRGAWRLTEEVPRG